MKFCILASAAFIAAADVGDEVGNYGWVSHGKCIDTYYEHDSTGLTVAECATTCGEGAYMTYMPSQNRCLCDIDGDCTDDVRFGQTTFDTYLYSGTPSSIGNYQHPTTGRCLRSFFEDTQDNSGLTLWGCAAHCGTAPVMTYSTNTGSCWCDTDGDCVPADRNGMITWFTYDWAPITPAPTAAPTAAPVNTGGNAEANQDPHITNVHGRHFQLHSSGVFNMITLKGDSQNVLRVSANIVAAKNIACAPSFIRSVKASIGQDIEVSIARGSGQSFLEVDHESFVFSLDRHNWISHPLQSQVMASGDGWSLKAEGIVECDDLKDNANCQKFQLATPHADLSIKAGRGVQGRRHYLNLGVARLNANNFSASGLLWDDMPSDKACA